jgi:hypothetical protein
MPGIGAGSSVCSVANVGTNGLFEYTGGLLDCVDCSPNENVRLEKGFGCLTKSRCEVSITMYLFTAIVLGDACTIAESEWDPTI